MWPLRSNLRVSQIGPIDELLLLVEHFGSIRDTIKSTLAATQNSFRNELHTPFLPYFDKDEINIEYVLFR